MSEQFTARIDPTGCHTAIRVNDMRRALHFYHELVGLPIERTSGPADNPQTAWLPGVQLIHDPEARPVLGQTFDHLAFGIDNVEEVCARLDAAGYKAETPLQQRGREDVGRRLTMAFYRDPEGNKFEVLRYDE